MEGNPTCYQTVTASIATDNTVSQSINIQGANRVMVNCPTFACYVSATNLSLFVQVNNTTSTADYRRLVTGAIVSGSSGGIQDWQTFDFAGQRVVEMPVNGCKLIKLESSQTATGALELPVHIIS